MKTQGVQSRSGDIGIHPSNPQETCVPRGLCMSGRQGEELIMDDRWGLRPAQIVEVKLANLLKGEFVLVSQLRLRHLIANCC